MSTGSGTHRFATTRWSVVVRAGEASELTSRAALEDLCAAYWHPVYAFARRRGSAPEVAEDLVQGFFCDLLERRDVSRADPERGRFRTFLRTAFRNYESKLRERDGAQKRGGGRRAVPIDGSDAEARFVELESAGDDPERLFERAWALSLIESAVRRLEREYEDGDKAALFRALRPGLAGEGLGRPLVELAEELGTTEGAVKVAAHRLRQRFGQVLRREVGDTVSDPDEVEAELRGLFEALG